MQLPASRIALVCLASLLVACGGDRAVSPTASVIDGFGALAPEKKGGGGSTAMLALFSGALDSRVSPGPEQAVNVKIKGDVIEGNSDSFLLSLNFEDGVNGVECERKFGDPPTANHVTDFRSGQPRQGTFNFRIDEKNLQFGIVFNFRFPHEESGFEYKIAAGGGTLSTDPTTVTVTGGSIRVSKVQKKGKPIQDGLSCSPISFVFTVGPS